MTNSNYESMGLLWFVEMMNFNTQCPVTDVTNNNMRVIGSNLVVSVDEYAIYINKAKECINQYLKNNTQKAIEMMLLYEACEGMRPTVILEFFYIYNTNKTVLEDAKNGYFKVISANFGDKSWSDNG